MSALSWMKDGEDMYGRYPWAYPANTSNPIAAQSEATYEDYKKIKGFEDVGYLLQDYVISGGVTTRDALRNDTIDVSDIVVSLNNDVMARNGTSFQTSIPNTTYHLDFTKDGDWHWGTSHADGTVNEDYLTVADVTADASGLVGTIADKRCPVGGFRLQSDYGLTDLIRVANVRDFGAQGGTANDTQAVRDAVDAAIANGLNTLYLPFSEITLASDVDCKGLLVMGEDTVINGLLKNAKGFSRVFINNIDYDDTQFSPTFVPSVGSSKALFRYSVDRYYLLTKKATGKGYMLYVLNRNVTTSANSTNFGPPGELLRVTGLLNLTDAVVYKHELSDSGGTIDTFEYMYPSGVAGAAVVFWRNASKLATDYLEFEVEVPEEGVFNIAFLLTNSSSSAATIKVDGDTIDTVDLTDPVSAVLVREYPAKPGTHTVRITAEQNNSYIYVAGVNYYKLGNAKPDLDYDSYAYRRDDNYYIISQGAVDYAIFDNDIGKWVGSYHGGETLISESITVDGEVMSMAVNDVIVGTNISIEQVTDINGKLTSNTLQRWLGDGAFEFYCNMSGEITARTFYSCMTTTNSTFSEIVYPKRHVIDPSDDDNVYLGRNNQVVQRNPETNQKVTTLFSLFNKDNNALGGVYVLPDFGTYNKVYYGKVAESLETITDIRFQTIRLFE